MTTGKAPISGRTIADASSAVRKPSSTNPRMADAQPV